MSDFSITLIDDAFGQEAAFHLTAHHLQLRHYRWSAVGPANIRVPRSPDKTTLDRAEGYEVLAFINSVMSSRPAGSSILEGQQIERMVQAAPAELTTRAQVAAWIQQSWYAS